MSGDLKSAQSDYVLEDQVGYLLRRAHQRATAIFMEAMAEFELTPRQFSALVKVMQQDLVSQNELGRLIAVDPATMQGVVRRLGQRGLMTRRPDPDDRRRILLSLTAAGQRVAERALSAGGQRITSETLAPLRAEERKSFLRLLKKLN
ncbi:MAG: winged helix-turn-helix transcriptional regulator [Alphaproteobacteria bacterium]|nr:winged helix-turn-helix transcriptional regulator [Alphaproteobacteria bacterium]